MIALLLFFFLFQSGRTVTPPLQVPATVNFYISTAGSDSNPCTSASKCLTLAHVRQLIPQTLDANYVINVATGTYAEPLDMTGFVASGGDQTSTYGTTIKILGNTGTPANVVFSGTAKCLEYPDEPNYLEGACISGSAKIQLYGLTISSNKRTGIACFNGNVEYNSVVVTMTGGRTLESVGVDHHSCHYLISGNLLITGFETDAAPTGGIGIYNDFGSQGFYAAGNITITGPGTGTYADAEGTYGFVSEFNGGGFAFQCSTGCTMAISGVQTGVHFAEANSFVQVSASSTIALNITNGTTTPTNSEGINTVTGGTLKWTGSSGVTFSIDHYTTCLHADQQSIIIEGPGSGTRSLTNCTPTLQTNSGVVLLF